MKNVFLPDNISLEKTILITLASEYKKDENNYYTTTEISHLIKKYFGNVKKNKNNISRYFNQTYYPYYEIRKEKNKVKYRLSPSGYSEACNIKIETKGKNEN